MGPRHWHVSVDFTGIPIPGRAEDAGPRRGQAQSGAGGEANSLGASGSSLELSKQVGSVW